MEAHVTYGKISYIYTTLYESTRKWPLDFPCQEISVIAHQFHLFCRLPRVNPSTIPNGGLKKKKLLFQVLIYSIRRAI